MGLKGLGGGMLRTRRARIRSHPNHMSNFDGYAGCNGNTVNLDFPCCNARFTNFMTGAAIRCRILPALRDDAVVHRLVDVGGLLRVQVDTGLPCGPSAIATRY